MLEILAACMRHRQSALICLQYEDLVWPVTVFPTELVYHSPRDVALAAARRAGDAEGAVLRRTRACGRPGHWMHERVGRMEHYHPLKPLLWNLALNGPRNELLSEIAGNAAYRVTLSREDRLLAPGALGPAADRLRSESASLRDIATLAGHEHRPRLPAAERAVPDLGADGHAQPPGRAARRHHAQPLDGPRQAAPLAAAAEDPGAGKARARAQPLLDAQRLVPLGHALAARERAHLELADAPADGQVRRCVVSSLSPERAETMPA